VARTESELTTVAVQAIAAGMPLREASRVYRRSVSALVRACQRAGLVLPRGRRPKAAPEGAVATTLPPEA